jgi:hypothetical protein
MRNAGTRLAWRWLLATSLLMLGLVLSGSTCAKATADQWPARVQARAVSAQQNLERRAAKSETKEEQTSAAPLATLLLLVSAAIFFRSERQSIRIVSVPRNTSLWLTPHLFRPPPVALAR